MNVTFAKGILLFVTLLLVQILVFNHIHLFNCATPIIYIYIALRFKRDFPRWGMLLACFLMGLSVDIFSNTAGMATISMTFIGFVRPYLLLPFLNRDSADDLSPDMNTLGTAKFVYFTAITTLLYCILFFTIESFSFANWQQWADCVGGSFALTTVLILVIENARKL